METMITVDWDFFFPHLPEFDWGHRESSLFFETAWVSRTADATLFTRKNALDVMQPDQEMLRDFWEQICPNGIGSLVVAESHLSALTFIKAYHPERIINYDTHHDYYYECTPKNLKEVDCGNWGSYSHKRSYTSNITWVHSPIIDDTTSELKKFGPFASQTTLVEDVGFVGCLFVCRSPCWTPTWCDHLWLEFIQKWETLDAHAWNSRRSATTVMQERRPNLSEAYDLRKQFLKSYDLVRKMAVGVDNA
jgi:hypothetical protein